MLKVTDTEEYVVDKVMDVLSKNMQMEQIIIKSDPTILSFPNLDIHLKEQKIYLNDKYISLNRHEFDTLVYLAGHPGWVRSKEQIYEAVWREEVADYENAVMCASVNFVRNWGINRRVHLILKQFGVWDINLIMGCKKKAVLHVGSTAFDMVY